MSSFTTLFNFDVFNVNGIHQEIYKFSNNDTVSEESYPNFFILGYCYTDFINSENSDFVPIEILPFFLLIMIITYPIKIKIVQKVYSFLSHKIFFSASLRYLIESYLKLTINSTFSILYLQPKNYGAYFSLSMSYIMFVLISVGPLVFLYFLAKNWDRLGEEAFDSRLSEITETL